jgi:hypothetical protein
MGNRAAVSMAIALVLPLAACSSGGDDGDGEGARAGSGASAAGSSGGGGSAASGGGGGRPGTDAGTPSRDAAASGNGGSGSGGRDAAPPDAGGTDAAAGAPCALPAPIDQGITYDRTLHVSAAGSAGAGDGSEGNPFATIDEALSEASPGTRVLVDAGRYGPFSAENLQGEAGRPIAIVADGAVTLEARGESAIIGLSDPAYLVIEGFTLSGAPVHGMNIDDGGSYDTPAHHVVLRNLTIPGAGSGDNNDCIKLSGVDDFWVLDSDVSGCDMGEIIDMVGCHRGVISGNHFHDTIQNGVQAKGGSADTLIHGNLFENIPARAVNAGGSTGLEFFRPLDAPHEAARIAIIANVFVRGGMTSGAAVAYVGCDGCVAAHNTIIEPRTWVARILQESTDARFVPSRAGLFVNNLIALNAADLRAELVNVGPGTDPASFVFGNNLWFAEGEDASWQPVLGGGVPDESGSILQEDPGMADRAGGDYHLLADSPARGAARALAQPLPPDYDGRCYAQPAALGAFEGQ